MVALSAAGCGGGVRDAPVTALQFIGTDGRVLTVGIDSCNAEPTLVIGEQSDARVVLAATAERNAGGDCADGGVVTLDEPLGDRALLDATTGAPLIVDGVQVYDGNNPASAEE